MGPRGFEPLSTGPKPVTLSRLSYGPFNTSKTSIFKYIFPNQNALKICQFIVKSTFNKMLIITHTDADGIISAHLIQKALGPGKVFFENQATLPKFLNLLSKRKKEKLVILDISPSRKLLEKASSFPEIIWIDHHQPLNLETPKNVKMVIRPIASTASIIAEKYKIENRLVSIANEIDTNNIKSEDAEKLRDYITYIKDTAKGIIFKPMAKQLMKKLDNLNFLSIPQITLSVAAHKVSEIKKFDSLVVDERETRLGKLMFIEVRQHIPTFEILKKYNSDYIVIFRRMRQGTKIEFRTGAKKNVLKLAGLFGGGGHLNAAGSFTKNKNISNIKKKIVNFIKKKA